MTAAASPPPHRAAGVGLAILTTPVVVVTLWLAYRALGGGSAKHAAAAGAGGVVLLALALIAWRWPTSRARLSAVLASTWFGLLAVEALLTVVAPPTMREAILAQGLPYDTRPLAGYVADCDAEGRTCHPVLMSRDFFRTHRSLDVGGTPHVPLAGLADTDTVLCNEWGPYVEFHSDAHGFNNPPTIWSAPSPSTVVVGDSFVVGYCVPGQDQLVHRLEQALGTPTVNLGMAGNGPLSELAGIREYLPLLEPRDVVWVYYEGNDLDDLAIELTHPVLARYLEPDFNQGLASHREALQAAIGEHIAESGGSALAGTGDGGPSGFRRFITLTRTRGALALLPKLLAAPRVDVFRQILAQAKAEVEAADARLHFVYLPRYECLLAGPDACASEREAVMGVASALALDPLDLSAALSAVDDPKTLFPAGLPGHFDADGYDLVARTIATHLRR